MNWNLVIEAVIFSLFGAVVFALSLWVMEKVTPFSIRKEIIDEHNTALAIVIAAMVLGLSFIIGMAHG